MNMLVKIYMNIISLVRGEPYNYYFKKNPLILNIYINKYKEFMKTILFDS